ncbi:sensor histidine kinase [Pseudorhodoferax sp. Leaf274]|uniref:sensor histidine kinase n=1 Tax=Pseudorhodoferax sp. Leaf274 TaxID=1736318 RepID=UPI000702A75C|nr:sensor histidine kinase [Pseudorhodoferax sp. Leaf274]KQP39016.1 hypothetical protein ASF44_11385 [Pseudorhodoferax sp. Leaf274]
MSMALPAVAVHGSIRRRLLATLGGLFVAAMVVLAIAAQAYGRRAADLSFDRLLAASLLAMGEATVVDRGRWDMDLPYAALDLLGQAQDDRVFYSLRAPDGTVVTGYDDLPLPPAPLQREAERRAVHALGAQDLRPVFFDAVYRGAPVRFAVASHWAAGAGGPGQAWLQVGQTRTARDALAADITRNAMGAIALLTLAALALCAWGVQRALAPVERLGREIGARAASDLQAIATPVPREMAPAVGALNGFMARLADNLDALRVFIAEAAHQMRTPLASLRAQAQMALDEPDATEQRRGLVAVERNAARLTRLLNQLLADASVSHRGSLGRFEPVDLAQVVREALHETMPRAEPQPVVRADLPAAPAWLRGDALMLREAVKNLLDNALRHGAPPLGEDEAPTQIDVRLHAEGGGWRIGVGDRGPGLDAAALPGLFERFTRGPGARPGGAGLGLAIVRRVVERHGGRAEVRLRAGGGLELLLWLPGMAP